MAQTLLSWPYEIHIIGMGGIGTHVLQALLENGARQVHIWDEDIVESHNLPTQFLYSRLDIGYSKVSSAVRFVEERGFETEVIAHEEWVTRQTKLSGIVLSGVHTMSARSEIWKALEFNSEVFLYIDARIGGDSIQVHTMDPNLPDDVSRYRGWLFSDSEALELGCATRENPHSALAVASILSSHLALFLRDEPIIGYVERDLLSESQSLQHSLRAEV